MPRSKNRTEHKLHQQHHNHTHGSTFKEPVRISTAKTFTVPVCILFGGGIAWFAAGEPTWWIAAGVIAGSVVGYFLGNKMDQAFSKK